MYCTAVGKAILSALPLPEVSAILDQSRLVAKTPKTLISKEAILSQLETVRADGYALDLEELEEGLVCVAASVLDMQGRPVAALSCSGPKQRMSEERVRRIADLLKLHARQASYIIS
jgi:IclR family KDG regulon transcriptional repressor